MESRGGAARIFAGFLNAAGIGAFPGAEAVIGAIGTAGVALLIRAGRALFVVNTDSRAHRAIRESMRGEFAEFEIRLLDRLGKEFTRTAVIESRFAAVDERAARVERDVRDLRAQMGQCCGGRRASS